MQFRPTLKETARWFSTSQDTVERRIKKWTRLTFTEFKEKHSMNIKYKLIDRAIDMAMSGNATMMIFCLKNYCGWSDKSEEKELELKPIVLAYSKEGLQSAARD